MSAYAISYDLHNNRNYQPLWDALARLGAVRLLESLWLVKSSLGIIQIRDQLQSAMDNDDSIAVLLLGNSWAVNRANANGVAFLKANVAA